MGTQNPNLYNVNYQGVETNLTPPNHRTPVWLAWLKVLLYPLQWLHNNFFTDYANGSTDAFYNYESTYNIGDRVIDIDNAVYECEVNGFGGAAWSSSDTYSIDSYATYNNQLWQSLTADNINHIPGADTINWQTTAPHLNLTAWWQVSPDYRGVRPQTLFNSQKLVLEGILNQYFRTTFRQPPYTHITGAQRIATGSGYTTATAVITGEYGTGIGATADMILLSGEILIVRLTNPGFGYLNPTISITGDGTGATAELFTEGTAYPDIFINNNLLLNTVFVVGFTEQESSDAVYENSEAIDYVVYENSDYNFNATDFTIFVPQTFYDNLAPTGIAGIQITDPGSGYRDFTAPTVTISSPDVTGGIQATASAFVYPIPIPFGDWDYTGPTYVISITLINAGSGYTVTPTVTISGGTGITPARAVATLQTATRDNIIRAVADKYVIAGMTYDIQPYSL